MNEKLKTLDDTQLVRRFMDGDEDIFEELLRRYKGRVFTTIYMIAKDREKAEDIFQDVMIKVIRMMRQGKYNEEGKFLPWVVRIARNLAIDHFRKIQRTPVQRELENGDIFNLIPRKDLNVEQQIIKEEKARYIRNLIQRLPDKQKDVLIMRHYGELSFKEISNLTGVSINTALGRMRYALINLRKLMDVKENEHGPKRRLEQG